MLTRIIRLVRGSNFNIYLAGQIIYLNILYKVNNRIFSLKKFQAFNILNCSISHHNINNGSRDIPNNR